MIDTFDPNEHTVSEVLAYVENHPEDTNDLLQAEKKGKSRVTLVDALTDLAPTIAEDESDESSRMVCPDCAGSGIGFISGVRAGTCEPCEGTGEVDVTEVEK